MAYQSLLLQISPSGHAVLHSCAKVVQRVAAHRLSATTWQNLSTVVMQGETGQVCTEFIEPENVCVCVWGGGGGGGYIIFLT